MSMLSDSSASSSSMSSPPATQRSRTTVGSPPGSITSSQCARSRNSFTFSCSMGSERHSKEPLSVRSFVAQFIGVCRIAPEELLDIVPFWRDREVTVTMELLESHNLRLSCLTGLIWCLQRCKTTLNKIEIEIHIRECLCVHCVCIGLNSHKNMPMHSEASAPHHFE